jgi:uncharacterized repeat protein (TIGR03803 family)
MQSWMMTVLSRGGAAVFCLALALPVIPTARAAKLTVIYSFCAQTNCTDGANPDGGLIADPAGNLYGTTLDGGDQTVGFGHGTVFQLQPNDSGTWTYKNVYVFCQCDKGAVPTGDLIRDVNGNLYGVAESGGKVENSIEDGGTAFELMPKRTGKWRLKRLHAFCPDQCGTDGANPKAGLTYAGAANGAAYDGVSPLFGTTYYGGSSTETTFGGGVAFQLAPVTGTTRWKETVLYNFCSQPNCNDGSQPEASLLAAANGDLLGTASGVQSGTPGQLFQLTPRGKQWSENVLYSFCTTNCRDGAAPVGKLIADAAGNLYGTASEAGKFCNFTVNCGTVFELPAGGGELRVLHSFCTQFNCRDGKTPVAGLVMDAAGNMYGTASEGGGNDLDDSAGGGVVYEIDHTGKFSVLHRFCAKSGCTDGDHPLGDLMLDTAGRLFGTTSAGGAYGQGEVFALSMD